MEKERELAIEILQIFEDFLEEKEIKIPNPERDEYKADKDTKKAILFGSDFYTLEEAITQLIKSK